MFFTSRRKQCLLGCVPSPQGKPLVRFSAPFVSPWFGTIWSCIKILGFNSQNDQSCYASLKNPKIFKSMRISLARHQYSETRKSSCSKKHIVAKNIIIYKCLQMFTKGKCFSDSSSFILLGFFLSILFLLNENKDNLCL